MKNKKFLVALAENVSQMPQEDIQKLRLIFTNRRAIKYFLKEYRSIKQGVFFAAMRHHKRLCTATFATQNCR